VLETKEEGDMNAEERHDIMEVKVFVDPHGHEVRQFSQVFGKNKRPDFYHGMAVMSFKVRNQFGQDMIQQRPMEFPFPEGIGLKTAFDTFDEVAEKHAATIVAKSKEQAAASRIVPATSIPKNIVGKDGKSLQG
jgi:hypothetical protein